MTKRKAEKETKKDSPNKKTKKTELEKKSKRKTINDELDQDVVVTKKTRSGKLISIIAGDDNHYAAKIRSSKFKGKTRVQQHQMVYASLKGKMGKELHALALTTEEK